MLDRPAYTPDNWFWTINGDTSRYWSSASAAYVAVLPENAGITNIDSEASLWGVLRDQFPAGLPLDQRSVLKSIVQARIIAAGKMPQAYSALTANSVYFARWFAPDRPVVNCNDPDAVGLVQALGLDPAVILAP